MSDRFSPIRRGMEKFVEYQTSLHFGQVIWQWQKVVLCIIPVFAVLSLENFGSDLPFFSTTVMLSLIIGGFCALPYGAYYQLCSRWIIPREKYSDIQTRLKSGNAMIRLFFAYGILGSVPFFAFMSVLQNRAQIEAFICRILRFPVELPLNQAEVAEYGYLLDFVYVPFFVIWTFYLSLLPTRPLRIGGKEI